MTDPKTSQAQMPQAGTTAGLRQTAGSGLPSRRNFVFVALLAASAVLFWGPLKTLIEFSMRPEHAYDQYSITVLIPFLSAALVYAARKRIFESVEYSLKAGGILLLVGIAAGWYARRGAGILEAGTALSLAILGLTILWMGGFVVCYGGRAFRAALFPLLFLVLMVPLPSVLLSGPVTFVRQGSADIASLMFHMFGVPVFRNGIIFTLTGLTIEVAKECSGIHSILALFIVSLLAGHLSPLGGWKRLILALLVFPIVCITNGLRIGTLALLSAYVDPRIIHSSLHRDGGILFFLLGFGLLMISLQLLNKVGSPTAASDGDGK